MKIETLEEKGVHILVLDGRLETNTTAIYDQCFLSAYEAGSEKFVLDCSNLTYISSVGLRSILQSLKRLSAGDGELAIAAPLPMVMEVFEISGFKSLLTIRPDRSAAVSALLSD